MNHCVLINLCLGIGRYPPSPIWPWSKDLHSIKLQIIKRWRCIKHKPHTWIISLYMNHLLVQQSPGYWNLVICVINHTLRSIHDVIPILLLNIATLIALQLPLANHSIVYANIESMLNFAIERTVRSSYYVIWQMSFCLVLNLLYYGFIQYFLLLFGYFFCWLHLLMLTGYEKWNP